MVGYSDSAKEVGMLAANLELYAAQRATGGVGARARRCGSRSSTAAAARLGRGGGPASRAIPAAATRFGATAGSR